MAKGIYLIVFVLGLVFFFPQTAYAMHIMEGFLPIKWAAFWFLATIPFVFHGLRCIEKKVQEMPGLKMLLAFAGAFAFVLSALKLPSITGSSSHLTGVGLGAILFGPTPMAVISTIILLFQALLLAHGGISTLGANIFSMGIMGPLVAYGIHRGMVKAGCSRNVGVFLAAAAGNLVTYLVTSLQLSLVYHEAGGITAAFVKFAAIFAVTQIPLAIAEGLLTVVVINFLMKYNLTELQAISVFSKGVNDE